MPSELQSKTAESQESLFDHLKFDPRFLERLAGRKLLNDPRVAVVELVANAWDAGATKVKIVWPTQASGEFRIEDNGEGMTEEQFLERWPWMAYNRMTHQGKTVKLPGGNAHPPRRVYGRNGIGRFAAFCFGDEYELTTRRDGREAKYLLRRGENDARPFDQERIASVEKLGHGTTICVPVCRALRLEEDAIRAELAMRFLADPLFSIQVNRQKVDFHSIPEENVQVSKLDVDGLGLVEVVAIDTSKADRTMQRHGVAFHVNNRLVGTIDWRQPGFTQTVDGRSVQGKRLLFIVKVDALQDFDAVKEDWTGFDEENEHYKRVVEAVERHILGVSEELNEEDQEEVLKQATEACAPALQKMRTTDIETWTDFVKKAQAECRSVKRADLVRLAELLANLEASRSKYALMERLAELRPGQLDDLHGVLEQWTVDTAKLVLDEIRMRMKLLADLEQKTADKTTDEVQELQPLFEKGLWIFGPEYETIHYTSNRQMVTVIRELFGRKDIPASQNRPDFVIVPEGSLGCYTYPKFGRLADGDSGERGVAKLVVVELKRPGVVVADDQKNQAWKYVEELVDRGLVTMDVQVDAFVIGSEIKPSAVSDRTEGSCKIMPMLFSDVIIRARSRLHGLYDRVREAPFMKQAIAEWDAIDRKVRERAPLFEEQQLRRH